MIEERLGNSTKNTTCFLQPCFESLIILGYLPVCCLPTVVMVLLTWKRPMNREGSACKE